MQILSLLFYIENLQLANLTMSNFQGYIREIQVPGQLKNQGNSFPKVYGPGQINNYAQLQYFFAINNTELTKQLNQVGALYFRGFDIKSANQVASVMNKFGKKPFQYIGGAAVRKLIIGSQNKKNSESVQVFTTNEAPPHEPIPFHNELLQNDNYPQYIAFYCLSQAETGGSTPIVNCHQIYNYLNQKHPEFLKNLEEKKVRYIRVVGAQDNPDSPIGRGWKNIFKASDKKDAEQKMVNAGYQYQWLQGQDCKLVSKPLSAIFVSKSGKKVFCNQIIAVFKGWIDNKNKPQDCLKFGDFSEIPKEILNEIFYFADKNKVSIPWKKGDLMILDNQMTKHSRQPFTGKNRKIMAMLFKGQRKICDQPNCTLRSGDQMPLLGFGTWKIARESCADTVYKAIKSGYRLMDCACDYGNQIEVGEGIKKAIDQKIISRQDIFITSKLWNTFHRPQHVKEGCLKTIKDLGVQFLDLYLMHFPIALKYVPIQQRYPPEWAHDSKAQNKCMIQQNIPLIDTWRAMEQLVKEGLVRNIGVCNFNVSILRDLINTSTIKPSVLQIQLHPLLSQKVLQRFCRQNGIPITSFSTFGASSYVEIGMAKQQQKLASNQVINDIAKNKKKTPYQVALRWAVQQGLAVIPKTINEERMKQNRDVVSWRLDERQMQCIDELNQNRRYNDPGVFCELAFGTFFPIYE